MTVFKCTEWFINHNGYLNYTGSLQVQFLTNFFPCWSQLWGEKSQVVSFGPKESIKCCQFVTCKMNVAVIVKKTALNSTTVRCFILKLPQHVLIVISSNHYCLQQKLNFIFILNTLALHYCYN